MKSGTTSLHEIINKSREIFIPKGEVNLFTLDDIDQFPQAFWSDGLVDQCINEYSELYKKWYDKIYEKAGNDQIIGEDSTHYLSSGKAMSRVSRLMPKTKIIIMLRDPLERVHSHYWHWVRTYRAIYSIEKTIRFRHGNMLQRSLYKKQMERVFDYFDSDQVMVIIFEEFVENKKRVIKKVCDFLEIKYDKKLLGGKTKYNASKYPYFPNVKLIRNLLVSKVYGAKYDGKIPRVDESSELSMSEKIVIKISNLISPNKLDKKPSLKKRTKNFLKKFLHRRNSGLEKILDRNLSKYWKTFQ